MQSVGQFRNIGSEQQVQASSIKHPGAASPSSNVNRQSSLSPSPNSYLQNLGDQKQSSGIGSLVNAYQGGRSFGAGQRARDRSNGIGTIQGLLTMDARMQRARYSSELTNSFVPALAASVAQGDTAPLEAFGSAAQQWQLQELQNQAISYGLSQLGIDTSTLSNTEIGAYALEYLGVDTSASAAGSASTPATGGTSASGFLSAAGAAYSGYQMIDNWGESNWKAGASQGASMGAYVGSFFGGWGSAVGALAGAAIGAVAGSIKSGKHQDQKVRDSGRDFLQSRGMIDEKYQLALADGTGFDIGVDGGHRFENLDGTERAAYQTDTSNPLTDKAIAWLDPLAEVLMGGNEKLRSDFTGYFVNAATSNASNHLQLRENALAIYAQSDITPQAVFETVAQLAQSGKIDEGRAAAYFNSLQELFAPVSSSTQLVQ